MIGQIAIINRALQALGVHTITALTDATEVARACSRVWEPVLTALLREHPWAFAIKRVTLAPDVDVPAFGFSYQFSLPEDCLRVVFPSTYGTDWVIEGRKILTSLTDALQLRYVGLPENTAKFDALFAEALAARLALELSSTLTNSAGMWARMNNAYMAAVHAAKRAGAIEALPVTIVDDPWIFDRI